MRTRVKICGFTRAEDAVYASQLGVDAIGLVFYPPSPRHVDIDQAIAIVNALPAFTSVVALFVDEQEVRIREILARVPFLKGFSIRVAIYAAAQALIVYLQVYTAFMKTNSANL